MAHNELDLTTFLDPESRRDVRDWNAACGGKRSSREECVADRVRPQVPKRSVKSLLIAVALNYR
ncbi:hypothetical protein CH359_19225 [Leptospira meyeri]|nr:hypothetical protein CH359_19225 [Leptospira meyeri]PJZ95028.1 hypothetical protein CH358_19255 [Leptospira meyeri]